MCGMGRETHEMQIDRQTFERQRRPRFGTSNPERMRLAFWEWMIRGDETPPAESEDILGKFGMMMREGVLKSGYGPYRARDLFQVPLDRNDGPIWTFERMGATRTELPDGRVVCVGGEHEDHYDPDFCIYNDVVVLGPADQVEIYGYPRDVFPPTDFHTATLLGDRIIIVGRLGYPEERRPGHTPVYSLDPSGYSVTEIPSKGEAPGWLFEHEAELGPDGLITVRGGRIIQRQEGRERFRRNVEEYALDIRTGAWRRITDRNWCQFSVRQEDFRRFVLEAAPDRESLYPSTVYHAVEPCEDYRSVRFSVLGVPVSVTDETGAIEIIIEGELPDELADRIGEDVRHNVEAAIGRPCVLERVEPFAPPRAR